ncbi:MAG TPA: hypothetical protein VIJ14_06810 [Rhabdochlamydiaceae bacterium]
MAVELFINLKHLTFSRPITNNIEGDIPISVLQVSIWGALGTGAVAIISSLFTRSVIHQTSLKALAPDVLKVNLISCATCTVFASYIIYKLWKEKFLGEREGREARIDMNRQLAFLSKAVFISSALGTGAAIIARDFLNSPQRAKALADYSIQPLLWISITTLAIRLFHASQKIKGK